MCRAYPFFPDLPPKQVEHLLLLTEFELLLKSVAPEHACDLGQTRLYHEAVTKAYVVDTLSQAMQIKGAYLASQYVPRSDTLLLALHSRATPRRALWHSWESSKVVAKPTLNEWLQILRPVFSAEPGSGAVALLDLDGRRHGNIRGLEESLMPDARSVIHRVTYTSGAKTRFAFPNVKQLLYEENEKARTEKPRRMRKSESRSRSGTDMEEECPTERTNNKIRHFPEPLQSYQSTYVATMGGTTFYLRQDDNFQREAGKLRETLELGIANTQAQLTAACVPAAPTKDAKDSGGKEKDKDKNAAQKLEIEEKKKPLWPIVEDMDLAKANISWLEKTSMSCLVAHFFDNTRLHVAMHTSPILHEAELGHLSLLEVEDRLRPVTTLTFFTGMFRQEIFPSAAVRSRRVTTVDTAVTR
ncbi:hypothetical protein CSUI_008620 [Cystoisospora suis]|uniref:Uncharacterized protein n=1 Tax=Cystoisospora suis TaxID=483139 RepID=A0A2C6KME5_9APIC|nr:hypothetical protein CSUI_008620 [Cystoisospora suis]